MQEEINSVQSFGSEQYSTTREVVISRAIGFLKDGVMVTGIHIAQTGPKLVYECHFTHVADKYESSFVIANQTASALFANISPTGQPTPNFSTAIRTSKGLDPVFFPPCFVFLYWTGLRQDRGCMRLYSRIAIRTMHCSSMLGARH
jgi:hypothetical protein